MRHAFGVAWRFGTRTGALMFWAFSVLSAVVGVALATVGGISIARLLFQHRDSQKNLSHRSISVDRLLDFSQTIQGAGKPDQIFATLNHFLRNELSLSGLAILTSEAETVPAVQLRSAWPEDLVSSSLADMDSVLCPCLRQNLPRHFRSEGSPVRCSIDSALKFPPSHPAFCIPFTIGRKTQAVVHMLLPPGDDWSEER